MADWAAYLSRPPAEVTALRPMGDGELTGVEALQAQLASAQEAARAAERASPWAPMPPGWRRACWRGSRAARRGGTALPTMHRVDIDAAQRGLTAPEVLRA